MNYKTNFLYMPLWHYPMGGASALISRPHHKDFLCTKTNCQKPGGNDWTWNWQSHEEVGVLKNSQIIVDDWTTFEMTTQYRQWTRQEKVTPIHAISLHINELNIDEVQAPADIFILAWTTLFSSLRHSCDQRVQTSVKQLDYMHSTTTN